MGIEIKFLLYSGMENFLFSEQQKKDLRKIENEASRKQSDFYVHEGYTHFEVMPENEERPRNILFEGGFTPDEVREKSDKIYREHLVLGMKKAGFMDDQIISYIKSKVDKPSVVKECKQILGMS